jgi:hypothetical protein
LSVSQYDVPETREDAAVAALFYVHKRTKCILSPTEALAMLVHVIENPDGGANLNLAELKQRKRIKVLPSLKLPLCTACSWRGCVCVVLGGWVWFL